MLVTSHLHTTYLINHFFIYLSRVHGYPLVSERYLPGIRTRMNKRGSDLFPVDLRETGLDGNLNFYDGDDS